MRARTGWLLGAATLPFLLFLAVPIAALLYRASFTDIAAALAQATARQAIGLSFLTTLATVLVTVVSGTPVAYGLAGRPFRL